MYVCSAYRDPRKGYWCSSENPQPSRNIEIDHNVCRLTNLNCKTFAFIPFGASAPDLRDVEISNIYVHDNDLQTIGIWPDDPYDNVTASVPIKQVRFENNIYTKIQDNFYAAPISDISGLDCMTGMENGDFEHTGEVFWTLKKNTDPASAGAAENAVGQTGSWYGFIDRLEVGDAAIYQGLKLTAGVEYIFTADLQSSGDTCRMFVRDLDSGKLIAEQPFSHTAWTKNGLTFTVPKTGNYHIGIERGNARSGWARIDNASLTANVDPDLTTQGFTLFADCAATYERNGDGYRNELGFLFSAKVDGTVPAVRIYTTKNEQGTHYVSLWDDATGKLVSKEIYVWEIISGYEGWREFKLPAAVKIEAGRKYVVSVSAGPDCLYMWGENQLAAPKENEYLCTYAKGGRYSNDAKLGRIPRGEAASNYFRDIVFVPEV